MSGGWHLPLIGSLVKYVIVVGFPVGTLTNAITGKNIKPETAGRLAKILGVDILEIIKTE